MIKRNTTKGHYKDRICEKCGRLVKAGEWGSHTYYPCRQCNDEFWQKWYQLPKIKKIDTNFGTLSNEQLNLIHEYHKEDYFKIEKEAKISIE